MAFRGPPETEALPPNLFFGHRRFAPPLRSGRIPAGGRRPGGSLARIIYGSDYPLMLPIPADPGGADFSRIPRRNRREPGADHRTGGARVLGSNIRKLLPAGLAPAGNRV